VSVLQATYFDGKTSRRHPVSVLLSAGRLKVVGRDVDAQFDARRVRRSLRVADTPRWLYLPGGGALVTGDNDAVDRMTRLGRYERVLHRWESRPAYAVFSIALVAASLWLLVTQVVPVAVEHIAARIPVEAEAALGRETLSGMERYLLQPSKLPASRQARPSVSASAAAPRRSTNRRSSPGEIGFRRRSTKWTATRRSLKNRSAARVGCESLVPKTCAESAVTAQE